MKTPVPLLLLCALGLGIYLNAQDRAAHGIDLGAEARRNGMSVKAVRFGKSQATKTEGSGYSARSILAVELHPAVVEGDDLLILHLIQEPGKGAGIGNDKTCGLMDANQGVFPLVAYGFEQDGAISFSAVIPGQTGLLLAPAQQARSLYLAFKRPSHATGLLCVGIGGGAAMLLPQKPEK